MSVSRGRVTIALVLCLCLGIALAGASPAPSESTLLLERTASTDSLSSTQTDSLEDTRPRGRASSPRPRPPPPPPRPTPAVRHAVHVAQRAQARVVRAQVKAKIAVARVHNRVAALRSAVAHARGPAAVKLQKKLVRAEHKQQRLVVVTALRNQKAQSKLRVANLKLQTKQLKLQLRSGSLSKQQRQVLKARVRILKKEKRTARRALRKAARKLRKQRRRASRHKQKRWRRKLRHLKRKLSRSAPAKRARLQAKIRTLKIKRKAAKAKKRAKRGRKVRKAARKQKKVARRLGKLYGKLRNASKKAARAIRKQIHKMKKKFRKASRKALRRRHRKHRRHGRKHRRHGRKVRRHGRKHGRKGRRHGRKHGRKLRRHRRRHGRKHGRKGRRHGRRVKKLRRKQKKVARKLRRLAKKLKNASKRAAKKIQRKMRKLNKKLRKVARKARKHKRRGGRKVRRHGRRHRRHRRRQHRLSKKFRKLGRKAARKVRKAAKLKVDFMAKLRRAAAKAKSKLRRHSKSKKHVLRKLMRKMKKRAARKARKIGRKVNRKLRRARRRVPKAARKLRKLRRKMKARLALAKKKAAKKRLRKLAKKLRKMKKAAKKATGAAAKKIRATLRKVAAKARQLKKKVSKLAVKAVGAVTPVSKIRAKQYRQAKAKLQKRAAKLIKKAHKLKTKLAKLQTALSKASTPAQRTKIAAKLNKLRAKKAAIKKKAAAVKRTAAKIAAKGAKVVATQQLREKSAAFRKALPAKMSRARRQWMARRQAALRRWLSNNRRKFLARRYGAAKKGGRCPGSPSCRNPAAAAATVAASRAEMAAARADAAINAAKAVAAINRANAAADSAKTAATKAEAAAQVSNVQAKAINRAYTYDNARAAKIAAARRWAEKLARMRSKAAAFTRDRIAAAKKLAAFNRKIRNKLRRKIMKNTAKSQAIAAKIQARLKKKLLRLKQSFQLIAKRLAAKLKEARGEYGTLADVRMKLLAELMQSAQNDLNTLPETLRGPLNAEFRALVKEEAKIFEQLRVSQELELKLTEADSKAKRHEAVAALKAKYQLALLRKADRSAKLRKLYRKVRAKLAKKEKRARKARRRVHRMGLKRQVKAGARLKLSFRAKLARVKMAVKKGRAEMKALRAAFNRKLKRSARRFKAKLRRKRAKLARRARRLRRNRRRRGSKKSRKLRRKNRKGGKRNKLNKRKNKKAVKKDLKARKARKARKNRKVRKNRKNRKGRKGRKNRKARKLRRAALRRKLRKLFQRLKLKHKQFRAKQAAQRKAFQKAMRSRERLFRAKLKNQVTQLRNKATVLKTQGKTVFKAVVTKSVLRERKARKAFKKARKQLKKLKKLLRRNKVRAKIVRAKVRKVLQLNARAAERRLAQLRAQEVKTGKLRSQENRMKDKIKSQGAKVHKAALVELKKKAASAKLAETLKAKAALEKQRELSRKRRAALAAKMVEAQKRAKEALIAARRNATRAVEEGQKRVQQHLLQRQAAAAERVQNGGNPIKTSKSVSVFGKGYRAPQFTRFGPLVILGGVVYSKNIRQTLAYLPKKLRPASRHIFDTEVEHALTTRVDVLQSGKVQWHAGSGNVEAGWVSLEGMRFPRKGVVVKPVAPTAPWVNYGKPYAKLGYVKRGGYCSLSGLVRGQNWNTKEWGTQITQLPDACRPRDGRLVFKLNNQDTTHRVDVLPDGRVIWMAGDRRHAWISLDGIGFFVRSSNKLKLGKAWQNYGLSYRPASWKRFDQLCTLSGLVKTTRASRFIARVPKACRPNKKLIFHVSHNGQTWRLDLFPSGQLMWVDGVNSYNWVSLDGISYVVGGWQVYRKTSPLGQLARKRLRLIKGFKPYGGSYERPTYTRFGGLCLLNGVARSKQLKNSIARLPSVCRPDDRLVFDNHLYNSATVRTDVQPNGVMKWVYGPHNVNRGWLSMNGMLFATKGAWGRALNLTNDWVRFDQRYAKPQVIKRGDLCVVSGLVGLRDRSIAKDPNSKRWPSFIGTLPKNCRPKDGRLVFTVNHHGASLRVDVLPNGQIHYIAGARRHPWISLDGISFVTECASQPLRLAESWRPYGGAYRIPSFKRQSNLCVVSGVVAGGPKKVVGYLPEVCRPRKRQIFFVNHNQYVQRFDVLPNGIILWKNGRRSWPFAILDGIRFAVRPLNYSPDKVRHGPPPKQGPIRTYSGFAPLKNRFADPAFSRQGRICVLNGAVASSNLKGRWGRLPKNCRPKQRLAFTRTVANERNLRLDIEPGGNLEWKAGSGEGGWGSLAGMLFLTSKAPTTDIKLLFNWVNYLKGYARASFFKQGDLCVLQGTIRTDNSNLNRWNKNLGQLPKDCRPADGDLIFHVNHNEFALRVDITKNGEIIYRAGNKAYPFLSLDGIAFMTESSSRPLKLLSGFWPYTQDGSAFRVPSVKKQGTLCVLSGVANGNGQRAIAQLDEDCRPKGRLIFGTNSDNDALRIDILADGTIYWTGGVRKLPWISLDGIAFTAVGPAANRTALDIPPLLGTPLTLFSGYKPVALGWTSPQFTRVGSICVAYGLARGHNQKGVYGQFPEICRPSARLSFANPTFQQSPMRTDVLPNGDMIWAGGDRNGGRINLNSLSFPVAGTETAVLPLGSRWVDFGEDFGTARLAQEDQYCVITGTIRISDNNLANWNNHVATLPTECRPQNGRISFVVSHGEVNHRVDVRPDGVVEWVSGKKLHPSLALDGISFFPRDGTPLALEDGYSPYRQGFRIPSFKKQGVLCALSGMVAGVGGKNKHIATLPATCRPTGRLAFSAPHHDNTIQIDVLPDGRVIWSDIAATVGFVSLDGIHFIASGDPEGPLRTPPIPYDLVELSLQNGMEPRAGGFAKPQAAMFDHLCVLNGVMRGSDIKTVYTQLPRHCRPNKRLVLDLHTSSLQTARVDITSNGLVKWVDGATKSDFISLDGVTFATQGSDFKRVAPSVPWVDYGFGYEGASFYVQNGVCTVAGLIRLDGWNMAKWSPQLLILPPQCRPKDGVLTFNVNHGKATHQVDVYPDGRVLWVAGLDRVNAFISLSGITFPVAPPNQLTLADGWSARAEGYRAPAFEVTSSTCFLSGVVKGEGKNREVAVLPAECRPSASLIFFVNHNQHVQRFDVKPTGAVTWVDGPRFKDWVSLDGIRFTVANSEE